MHAADRFLRSNLGRAAQRRWRAKRQPSHVRIHGLELTLEPEWASPEIRNAIYEGWYERKEVGALRRTLRPDDRYLEIGGGLGVVCAIACSIVGDERVTVFEANPDLVEVARRTCQANGYAPEIVCAILGDSAERQTFFVHDAFWTSSLDETANARQISVPGRLLDEELRRIAPTYLMMDIEGAEVSLLTGRPLPDSLHTICMEVHPHVTGNSAVQRLVDHLVAEGFEYDFERSGGGVILLRRPGSVAGPAGVRSAADDVRRVDARS